MTTTSTDSPPTAVTTTLVVSVDWVRGAVVLAGDLDRYSAHHLSDALAALARTPHPCWELHTAAVTWCDVSGLRALAAAHQLARDSGRELRLVDPSRCVQRLVTLSGLDRLMAEQAAAERPRPASVGHNGKRVTGEAFAHRK